MDEKTVSTAPIFSAGDMLSEAECPFCKHVTVLRHIESHSSPAIVQKYCDHAVSYHPYGDNVTFRGDAV
jgi:hypothetical protein